MYFGWCNDLLNTYTLAYLSPLGSVRRLNMRLVLPQLDGPQTMQRIDWGSSDPCFGRFLLLESGDPASRSSASLTANVSFCFLNLII